MHSVTVPERVALLSIHSSPLARIGSGYAGGMNVYVRELANGLAGAGIAVDMFTRRTERDVPEIIELESGARLIHLDAGPARSLPKSVLPLHTPAAVDAIRAFTAREGIQYDVLHSHYWLSGLVASRVRQDARTPFLHMFHTLARVKELYFQRQDTSDSALRPDGERCVINHADLIVGATESERTYIERLYGRAPADFAVVPPGVDIDVFRPYDRAASRRELQLAGERVILFVGRLDRIKGLDIVLASLAEIRSRAREDVRLVVLGHDPVSERKQLAYYRQMAARLGIADRVEFRGVAPQEQLPLYYSAADLLAVPSAYESFGMAALEAMACQTPVVAFSVGGLSATVRDGQTGFLAQAGDRADFTRVLERALASPGLSHMERQARLAAQAYRWENVTERTIAVYGHLLRRSYSFGRAAGAT